MQEKQIVEGVVKNITDYGAFVDLGGVDGLLHVTDIAWRRVSHPTEVLSVGQTVTVQIIKINHETQRISLGMKQLQTDPWEGVAAKYPVGVQFKGKVTNVTDYGAFVELEPGVEGLVHVSEMSWVKKNMAPSKLVTPGTEVDVAVLEVDSNKRRISLGLKQTQENPWNAFTANHPAGTVIEGEIKSITEFGLFIGLDCGHRRHGAPVRPVLVQAGRGSHQGPMKRARWSRPRCWTSTSRRNASPWASSSWKATRSRRPAPAGGALRKNQVVTGTVTEVNDGGIEVELEGGVRSFIRRADLARDRNDQRPERFGKGDKVDALVTSVDKASRKVSPVHQGPRNLGREGSRGAVRFLRQRRQPGRHPGRGPEEEDAQEEGRATSKSSRPITQQKGAARGAPFLLVRVTVQLLPVAAESL